MHLKPVHRAIGPDADPEAATVRCLEERWTAQQSVGVTGGNTDRDRRPAAYDFERREDLSAGAEVGMSPRCTFARVGESKARRKRWTTGRLNAAFMTCLL